MTKRKVIPNGLKNETLAEGECHRTRRATIATTKNEKNEKPKRLVKECRKFVLEKFHGSRCEGLNCSVFLNRYTSQFYSLICRTKKNETFLLEKVEFLHKVEKNTHI